MKPFALEIHERPRSGSTVEELSIELQIPAERVAKRIRVAEQYLKLAERSGGVSQTATTRSSLSQIAVS